MSLLEHIWDHFRPLVEKGTKPSPQVITTSFMKPLQLVQSLLDDLPTFSPTVRFATAPSSPVAISPADWPTLTSMKVPAIVSKRSQILTYSIDHLELVSQAYKADNLRHAIIIALVAFQAYIADVKTLVTRAVTAACSEMEAEDASDGKIHLVVRRKSLRKWLATTNPLGYAVKGHEHLVSCMNSKSADHHEGLPNPTNVKPSVHNFSWLICNSRETNPAPITAPLISTGCSTPVFRIALAYMRKYARNKCTPKNFPKQWNARTVRKGLVRFF
ncbi:hypothetical protein DEU56DRAFT_914599 [Suillus clintonianus]|uniref:uncharacterized protein n=1 Tax=Suillus clintonianus TaxID=1904413 RepID=UPI001B8764D7|nr:uncharacterized protein DEU56DRAFT_914599 [Suillus clintonianus]KAG2131060.1 hypothetical protein DEU56DRAFT_914599 [Suillus clintonianus]